jgi:hypothetical protein
LPIFFTGLTFQGIAFEKQMYFYVWLLIGIVAWASKGVVTGEMHIRRTALDIFILAFLVVYGVSALLSVDRWHSFWGFFGDPSRGMISLIALALAYYFIMSHFTMKRFFLMFGGFLASGFLVVVWSILGVSGVSFLAGSDAVIRAAFSDWDGFHSRYFSFSTCSAVYHGAVSGLEEYVNEAGISPTFLGFIGLGLLGTLYLMLALYPFLLDTTKELSLMDGSARWHIFFSGVYSGTDCPTTRTAYLGADVCFRRHTCLSHDWKQFSFASDSSG